MPSITLHFLTRILTIRPVSWMFFDFALELDTGVVKL